MMSSNKEKITLEFTSTAVVGEDGDRVVERAVEACERYGFEFGIQVHNTSSEDKIRKAASFGVPLSVHAPLMSDYMINLGAEDCSPALKSLETSAAYMRELGASRAVFHGFTMTDRPVPAFGRGVPYDEAMGRIFRPELSLEGSRICSDFFASEEFARRIEWVRERMRRIKLDYPELTFIIENDFPAYGAANLLAEQAAYIDGAICLDSSHLWASCFIYDRDFAEQTAAFLATGKVEMVHLHASIYDERVPKAEWSDGHLSLATPNKMNLPGFVRQVKAAGVKDIVLEIFKADAEDIHAFGEMWFSD